MLVTNITPNNNQQNVLIDSKIVIDFDQSIDPFTVAHGISIYVLSNAQWTGPAMAILDTKFSDVLDPVEDFSVIPFIYTVEDIDGIVNGRVIITPVKSLVPDKEHFITIYPGNDSTRYLSKLTTSAPLVNAIGAESSATINITSSYTGKKNDVINAVFLSEKQINVYKTSEGISSAKTLTFNYDQEFNIGELRISISEGFSGGDSFTIDVFAASGVSQLIKNKFTTTHLTGSSLPKSTKVTSSSDLYSTSGSDIKLISCIPENKSINNSRYNPVTLKFNKNLEPTQNFAELVTIKRKDILSGIERYVNFYYKTNGPTLKLYMTTMRD